ncbi:MAG: glycosyltransferase [Rhodocyclaceae bacterium]|nr:glycosyltransferase [Rhodocyclaceae bacterium]
MARPRLLHVFSTFNVGGPQIRVTRMIDYWGPDVEHQICAHDGNYGARALLPAEAPVSYVHDMPLKEPGMWSRLRRLGAYLRAQRVDLVCTYNWGAMDVLLANRLFGRRLLVHHEEGFVLGETSRRETLRRYYRRLAYPGASRIVVVSRNLETIAREAWKQPSRRVAYLPNGIDVDLFSKPPHADAIPGFTRRPGEIVIGTVARLSEVKNLPLLVRAVARVAADHDIRLVIVGEGDQTRAIMHAAGQCGMENRLVLPGFVPRPQDYVGLFDIFALSSFSEQFPISLIEAMAAGLPCVATDVGDCREMLPEASRRFVTGSNDEEGLSLSLRSLVENPSLRSELGRANQEDVRARFSMETMMRRYEQLYSSVAGISIP